MPASKAKCDVKQAFDYEKDQQKSVGHILSLKIGDLELAKDLELTKPLPAQKFPKQKVVAAIEELTWDGGAASPMSCTCWISVHNKQKISEVLHTALGKTDVYFNFVVWEYDSVKTDFFQTFFPADEVDLKCLLVKEDKNLQLQLDEESGPNSEVTAPEIWKLTFKVRPQSQAQNIKLATKSGAPFVKTWGITVG
jgi:hypothetical protein